MNFVSYSLFHIYETVNWSDLTISYLTKSNNNVMKLSLKTLASYPIMFYKFEHNKLKGTIQLVHHKHVHINKNVHFYLVPWISSEITDSEWRMKHFFDVNPFIIMRMLGIFL